MMALNVMCLFQENMGTAAVAVAPNMPVNSSVDQYVSLTAQKKSKTLQLNSGCVFSLFIYRFVSQDMVEAFDAIEGKFRQIRSLTRRQKDHLKRFHGGSDTSNGNINLADITWLNLNPLVFLIE